jgi:hypothetical protein
MSNLDINSTESRNNKASTRNIEIPPSLQDLKTVKLIHKDFAKMVKNIEDFNKQSNTDKIFEQLVSVWENHEKNYKFKVASFKAKDLASIELILEQEISKAKSYFDLWINQNKKNYSQDDFDLQQLERRFLKRVNADRKKHIDYTR